MQGYTLSEEGKQLIEKYNTRKQICRVVYWVLVFFLSFGGCWLILKTTLPVFLQLVVVWLGCFTILVAFKVLVRQQLFQYVNILNVDGNPKLFLEVIHGLMRTGFWGNLKGKRKIQRENVNMINASAAYCHMGEYDMALKCLKEYASEENLKGIALLIYYNNTLACYAGLKDWEKMRLVFEQVEQTADEIRRGRYPRKVVRMAELYYDSCRHVMMTYEIMTLQGRHLAAELLDEAQAKARKETVLIRRMSLLWQMANCHIALKQYDYAVDALEVIVRKGRQLYAVTQAKMKLRMIHDRDIGIELIEEGECQEVMSLLNEQGKDISEEELRNSIIYVLHGENGDIAGVARITNVMKFGELVMNPLHDTDKNRFRLMEEMKRREYIETKSE